MSRHRISRSRKAGAGSGRATASTQKRGRQRRAGRASLCSSSSFSWSALDCVCAGQSASRPRSANTVAAHATKAPAASAVAVRLGWRVILAAEAIVSFHFLRILHLTLPMVCSLLEYEYPLRFQTCCGRVREFGLADVLVLLYQHTSRGRSRST